MLIALLGITNALALSIVERTREVGMLRAVGMTRRQIGGMVRTEAPSPQPSEPSRGPCSDS